MNRRHKAQLEKRNRRRRLLNKRAQNRRYQLLEEMNKKEEQAMDKRTERQVMKTTDNSMENHQHHGSIIYGSKLYGSIIDGACTCKGHKCGHCGEHDRHIIHAKVDDNEEPAGWYDMIGCEECVDKKKGTHLLCPFDDNLSHPRRFYGYPSSFRLASPAFEVDFFAGNISHS